VPAPMQLPPPLTFMSVRIGSRVIIRNGLNILYFQGGWVRGVSTKSKILCISNLEILDLCTSCTCPPPRSRGRLHRFTPPPFDWTSLISFHDTTIILVDLGVFILIPMLYFSALVLYSSYPCTSAIQVRIQDSINCRVCNVNSDHNLKRQQALPLFT